jgi:hypothetical protein
MSEPSPEQIAAELEQRAASYERLAAMEDNEHPEPDEFCSIAGGDGSRRTATVMRQAAALLRHPPGPLGEAGARLRALVAELQQCDAELLIAERLIEQPATDPLAWISGVRDRLRATIKALLSAPVVSPPREGHCTCWLGTSATYGDSEQRKACSVHRDVAVVTQEGESPCP